MLIHKERLTGSTSSGSLTLTTIKFSGIRLINIDVIPTNTGGTKTIYDVLIEDSANDDLFQELGIESILHRTVRIATYGSLKVTISNASQDEAFVVVLKAEE